MAYPVRSEEEVGLDLRASQSCPCKLCSMEDGRLPLLPAPSGHGITPTGACHPWFFRFTGGPSEPRGSQWTSIEEGYSRLAVWA